MSPTELSARFFAVNAKTDVRNDIMPVPQSLYHRLIFFSNTCSESPVTKTIDSVVFTDHIDYKKERAAKHPLFAVLQFSLEYFPFLYGFCTVLTALPGNN